jgi:hypothetical protein
VQWQPLVLPSYRGDIRAVFVVGPAALNKTDKKNEFLVMKFVSAIHKENPTKCDNISKFYYSIFV